MYAEKKSDLLAQCQTFFPLSLPSLPVFLFTPMAVTVAVAAQKLLLTKHQDWQSSNLESQPCQLFFAR